MTFGQVGEKVAEMLKGRRLDAYAHDFRGIVRLGGYNHMVGMATHDVAGTFAGAAEVLAPGMVFACDIQLFRLEEQIGIRIEDTIAVTDTGFENLSPGCPRTVAEIEALKRPTESSSRSRSWGSTERGPRKTMNRRTNVTKTAAGFTALLLALALAAPGQQPQTPVDYSKKPLQSERSRTYDAIHYLIKLGVDLDRKTFEGETTVTVASLRDGLEAVVLDAEEFEVASVRSDYGEPLTFSQSETELP